MIIPQQCLVSSFVFDRFIETLNRFSFLVKKSGSNEFLSSSALDYYNRFAKNRGIERYFRNSKIVRSNRASSDSSLNEKNDQAETENISSEFAKSLNNLKISGCDRLCDETPSKSDCPFPVIDQTDATEADDLFKTPQRTVTKHVEQETTHHSVKESSTMTDAPSPSDKHVNLNLHSKIEITLPPQPMPIPPPITKQLEGESKESLLTAGFTHPSLPPFYPPPKILYCTETQTTDVSEVEVVDEPIKANVQSKAESSKPDETGSSPNESVTSKEHRLEWDSLGDVGYQPLMIYDKSALSSTERKAIKSYMVKRGITSTENIIVFKNSPGKQEENARKAKGRPERRRSLTYNDNWLEVYTKYKDKYSVDTPNTALKSFNPDAQSTFVDKHHLRFVEQSAQTSLINLLCKSVQAETQTKDSSSVSVDAKASKSVESIEADTQPTETGSFVFMTGSPVKSKKGSKSPKRPTSNKDPKPKLKADEVDDVASQSNLNTKPNSDSSHKSSSMVDSSSSKDKENVSFDEELKMAIVLMNSVLESNTMQNDMKKSLVNKLVQKIIALKVSSKEQGEAIAKSRETIISTNSIACASSTEDERHGSTTKGTIEKTSSSEISGKSDKTSAIPESTHSSLKSSGLNFEIPASCENSSTLNKMTLVDDFVKQTLKPMTHSEVDYENHKIASHTSSLSSGNYASKECSSTVSDNDKGKNMSKKVGQLLTIEKEIERLMKLKELVQFDLKKRKVNERIYENVPGSQKSTYKKERSRLCTPASTDQNISVNLVLRKEKFVERYESQRGKLYEVPGASVGPSEVIYTKPYGTKQSTKSELKKVVLPESYKTQSRPVSSSSSSVVSHQRPPNENAHAVETQTTDSLKRIAPYFENDARSGKDAQKRPQIIYKTKLNKQIQTNCQEPLAYSIVFEGAKVKERQVTTEKETQEKEVEDDDSIDVRTLQEHLHDKRPKILKTMDQRNSCIRELRRLRERRNEQRKMLLILTSESALREKIRTLPPPPLGKFSDFDLPSKIQ